jgi:hypothetical protein
MKEKYNTDGDIAFNTLQPQDKKEYLDRRAWKVNRFFEKRGFTVQLKGNPESPFLILNNGIWLTAKLSNHKIIFYADPDYKVEADSIKLTEDSIENYSTKKLVDLIKLDSHTMAYKIKLVGHDLYLSGYEHEDRNKSRLADNNKMYPIFGRLKHQVWKTKDRANDIFNMIYDSYHVEVEQYQIKF